MKKFKVCPRCEGRTVIPFGWNCVKTCPKCDGYGKVEDVPSGKLLFVNHLAGGYIEYDPSKDRKP